MDDKKKYTDDELKDIYDNGRDENGILTKEALTILIMSKMIEKKHEFKTNLIGDTFDELETSADISPEHKLLSFHYLMKKVDKRNLIIKIKNISKKGAAIFVLIFSILYSSQRVLGFNLFTFLINNIHKQVELPTGIHINSDNLDSDFNLLWLPEGYTLKTNYKNQELYGSIYQSVYSNGTNEITLQIQTYNKLEDWNVWSETNGDAKEIKINNNIFYEASNYDIKQIIWYKPNKVYTLFGNTTQETLIEIIEKNKIIGENR